MLSIFDFGFPPVSFENSPLIVFRNVSLWKKNHIIPMPQSFKKNNSQELFPVQQNEISGNQIETHDTKYTEKNFLSVFFIYFFFKVKLFCLHICLFSEVFKLSNFVSEQKINKFLRKESNKYFMKFWKNLLLMPNIQKKNWKGI